MLLYTIHYRYSVFTHTYISNSILVRFKNTTKTKVSQTCTLQLNSSAIMGELQTEIWPSGRVAFAMGTASLSMAVYMS